MYPLLVEAESQCQIKCCCVQDTTYRKVCPKIWPPLCMLIVPGQFKLFLVFGKKILLFLFLKNPRVEKKPSHPASLIFLTDTSVFYARRAPTPSCLTPPNLRVCARQKVPAKRFKICHILYIYKNPKLLFRFSFRATLDFYLMNALGLCQHRPGHSLGKTIK